MLKVPQIVKTFFDSVPVRTIFDKPATLDDIEIHYFQGNRSTDGSFTLAVFNTFIEQNLVIPTDPISLSYSLILAHKSKFTLPKSNTIIGKSNCGILSMSHLGSPNNVLPLLIEDVETRTIKNLDTLNHEFSENNFTNQQAKLVNQLIDIKFYDIWIQCILVEQLEYKVLCELFGLDVTVDDNVVLKSSQTYEFLQQVTNWNSFKLRHPTLFEWSKTDHLANYYNIQTNEFEKDLELIIDYLNNNPETSILLKYKAAGYMISIDKFLKSTKLGDIVVKHGEFLNQCYDLLR